MTGPPSGKQKALPAFDIRAGRAKTNTTKEKLPKGGWGNALQGVFPKDPLPSQELVADTTSLIQ